MRKKLESELNRYFGLLEAAGIEREPNSWLFFFQAEDGKRDIGVLEFRRVLFRSEPPTKLVTIGEPHLLDTLEAHLKGVFRDRLYIAKSLPFFLELASPDVTKASGMEFVAQIGRASCRERV